MFSLSITVRSIGVGVNAVIALVNHQEVFKADSIPAVCIAAIGNLENKRCY